MSIQDPISDMLTHIRNGQFNRKKMVVFPASKIKISIASLLKEEGFIKDYTIELNDEKKFLRLELKYFRGNPVIDKIHRVSRPGIRVYRKKESLPEIMGGLGIAIISTSKGIMTDRSAKKIGIGGEILCYLS